MNNEDSRSLLEQAVMYCVNNPEVNPATTGMTSRELWHKAKDDVTAKYNELKEAHEKKTTPIEAHKPDTDNSTTLPKATP